MSLTSEGTTPKESELETFGAVRAAIKAFRCRAWACGAPEIFSSI